MAVVRAVVRDPYSIPVGTFPDASDGRLEVLPGDVTDPETLPLQGNVRAIFLQQRVRDTRAARLSTDTAHEK